MRKIGLLLATLALAGVAATVPGVSGGAIGDTNGPSCRDITNGQFNYTANGDGTYNLNSQLLLGPDGTTAACKQLTYTLYVIVDGTDPATAQAYAYDSNLQLTGVTITDDDNGICVYATTSHNGKVFDTAPDANFGCLVITTTTGGASGFN
jgi:hypothetical protein